MAAQIKNRLIERARKERQRLIGVRRIPSGRPLPSDQGGTGLGGTASRGVAQREAQ
jgi:hypothetical protein